MYGCEWCSLYVHVALANPLVVAMYAYLCIDKWTLNLGLPSREFLPALRASPSALSHTRYTDSRRLCVMCVM
jgi:hypothetical protein